MTDSNRRMTHAALGAWELALRYSRLDLDFHSGAAGTSATADAIRGGMQDIWTFGVNWYINTNVKLIWGQDAV
jgi:phosphate-selective porin OprO/OprP